MTPSTSARATQPGQPNAAASTDQLVTQASPRSTTPTQPQSPNRALRRPQSQFRPTAPRYPSVEVNAAKELTATAAKIFEVLDRPLMEKFTQAGYDMPAIIKFCEKCAVSRLSRQTPEQTKAFLEYVAAEPRTLQSYHPRRNDASTEHVNTLFDGQLTGLNYLFDLFSAGHLDVLELLEKCPLLNRQQATWLATEITAKSKAPTELAAWLINNILLSEAACNHFMNSSITDDLPIYAQNLTPQLATRMQARLQKLAALPDAALREQGLERSHAQAFGLLCDDLHSNVLPAAQQAFVYEQLAKWNAIRRGLGTFSLGLFATYYNELRAYGKVPEDALNILGLPTQPVEILQLRRDLQGESLPVEHCEELFKAYMLAHYREAIAQPTNYDQGVFAADKILGDKTWESFNEAACPISLDSFLEVARETDGFADIGVLQRPTDTADTYIYRFVRRSALIAYWESSPESYHQRLDPETKQRATLLCLAPESQASLQAWASRPDPEVA